MDKNRVCSARSVERARCDDECELKRRGASNGPRKIKIMLRPVESAGRRRRRTCSRCFAARRHAAGGEDRQDRFLLQHAQRYDFSSTESGATSEGFGEIFRLLIAQRFLMSHHWDRLAAQPPRRRGQTWPIRRRRRRQHPHLPWPLRPTACGHTRLSALLQCMRLP